MRTQSQEFKLVAYVCELIENQDDYILGIDWQELADAAMNYDDKISSDDFLFAVNYLNYHGVIEFIFDCSKFKLLLKPIKTC